MPILQDCLGETDAKAIRPIGLASRRHQVPAKTYHQPAIHLLFTVTTLGSSCDSTAFLATSRGRFAR